MLTAHVRSWTSKAWRCSVVRQRVPTASALLLLLVLLVAGALRGYQLRDQPIFIDEDLYTVAVLRLDSLSPRSIGRMAAQVVKPPLPLLGQALLARRTGDALTAGRVLSACGGLTTVLLTFLLGRRLGAGRASAGLIAASVYALSPVAVLHERMVLQDGLLTAAALGTVLADWSAVERGDPRRAALAAALGFVSVQIKLPGVALALGPALIVVANRPLNRPRVLSACIAASGPLISYLLLRLSPLGPFLSVQDEARFALLTSFEANSEALWDAARTYFPAGIGALTVLGTVRLARVNRAQLVVIVGMVGIWIVPWLFISNFAPSRYFLPAVPYLAALAGVGAAWLIDGLGQRHRLAGALARVAVVGALGTLGVLALGVAVDRPSAHLSQLDDWQYRSGWPAGGEYARAAALVARASQIDGRVYMINEQHLLAADAFDATPGQAWVIDSRGALPRAAEGRLLVMIDNVRVEAAGQLVEHTPGQHLDQLLLAAPGAQLIDFFPQAASQFGVAVLRVTLPVVS